jgi:hypothetical protein
MKHGKGTMRNPDGTGFLGEFKEGERQESKNQ